MPQPARLNFPGKNPGRGQRNIKEAITGYLKSLEKRKTKNDH
jgi:hypothetical protein